MVKNGRPYNEQISRQICLLGYLPRIVIVKDENGDLVADSHSIMARWRNNFSQIVNVHGVSDVRQAEIHTAEPLVPEPSALEF
jgi:hypothetical protein